MIINSQLGGKKPTGTKSITTNGVHDVTNYASADVQVPSSVPAHYIEKVKKTVVIGYYTYTETLCSGYNDLDLTGVKNISDYSLAYAYYQKDPTNTKTGTALKNATSLTLVSGDHALTYAFYNNTGITHTGLNYLQKINGSNSFISCFEKCSSLTNIGLDNLEEITSTAIYALARCFAESGITTADFIKLSKIDIWSAFGQNAYNSCFNSCTNLQNIYFRAVKASTFASLATQLKFLCGTTTGSSATGGCTIHFPSNFDPSNPDKTFDASTLDGYPTFGGSASYIHVAFDLPATE